MLRLFTLCSGMSTREEKLVLFLQGQSKTIDNGSENFKEFGNSVKSFGLVDELEEDIVDGPTNVGAEV